MTRRDFVTSAAASAAALSTGPTLLGMTDKGDGTPHPVIGAGEHKYECHHGWGELPPGYEWQTTHNVAFDSQGLVYITHQGIGKEMDTVLVFDPKGKFVRSFGKEWHGGGHGVEIRKEGSDEFAYLANTWTPKHKLVKTDLTGKVVWTKGRPETKEYEDTKRPYNPTNVSWLPDGGFTVGDGYGSNYLMHYDRDGKLTKVFGGPGTGPGQLRTPHGQWLDDRAKDKPVVVVCDRANARLQTFALDGTPLTATESEKVVLFPAHAKTRGDVLLVPDLHARVSLFGKDNALIAHLGEDPAWRKRVVGSLDPKAGPAVRKQPKEWPAGKFVHPHDAAFDKDGNIVVVEWVEPGRVTFLKKVT